MAFFRNMVSPLPLPLVSSSLLPVLKYSGHFKFSLSAREIWLWQIKTSYSPHQVRLGLNLLLRRSQIQSTSGFYSLAHASTWAQDRQVKARWSHDKWQKISQLAPLFAKIPFIQAVFVTGALSVNNASRYDDIDIMLVTSPHTLWLTRAILVLVLKRLHLRRNPGIGEHASLQVSDKVCDNLWLDAQHLRQPHPSLYVAHEILQARPLFDKSGIRYDLLTQNPWIKDYLPIAYTQVINQCAVETQSKILHILLLVLSPLNLVFWVLQRLYMSSRLTTEKVGLGFAFFHPRSFKDF